MSVRSAIRKKLLRLLQPSLAVFFCLLAGLASLSVAAQTPPGSTKRSGSVEGSPLDTLLSTRLWTTPPQAKDFVRETRPDPGSIDYTPLHGTDPDRPKPRDPANIKALQAELEHEIQTNEKRAKALGGVTKTDGARKARKSSTKGAASATR